MTADAARPDAARRRVGRVAALCAVLLAVGALAVGCAGSRDALEQGGKDVYAAGATARLGLQTHADGGLFATTRAALLDEMAREASDSIGELEIAAPGDSDDEAYRDAVLAAARAVLDGIHLAVAGDDAGAAGLLDENLDRLAELGAAG